MDENQDRDIIGLLERDDELCVKLLFERYYRALCVYCMRYLISYEDAEDIVQNVFVSFWQNKRGCSFTGSVRAYLFGAVSKAALKNMRDQGKKFFTEIEQQKEDCWEYMLKEPEEKQEQLREQLYAAVDSLPANPQKVLKDIIFHNKPYKVVAEEMNISVNTVKTHYIRALQHLRKVIDPKMLHFFLFIALPAKK